MSSAFRPLIFALAVTLARAAEPAVELPVATFFQAPTIAALTFSPNGKYIACLVPYERRMNLAVIDLEQGTKTLITNFKDKQATAPIWANNDRILFRVDDDGKESFSLFAVNRDGRDPVVLAGGYDKAGTEGGVNVRFHSILRRLENDAGGILVLANLTHYDWTDVARMSLKTGNMEIVAKAPGDVDYYVLDHKDQVRLAVVEDRQMRRVLYREANGKEWALLGEHHMDASGWEPIAFDGDNRTLFIWSDVGRKTRAVFRYDVATRQQLDLVFADDTYDVDSTIYNPAKKKIVGIAYDGDRRRFHWLDPELAKIHRQLEVSLPDTVHRPVQFAADGSRIIFSSYSDRDPGVYYVFESARNKVSELAVVKPGIDPDKLSPVKPITFNARDGLLLHGYLTIPKGSSGKNLPLVVHPHGGPFGPRDEWGFDPEVQFYASRGFAVLQVNYRGSGGYGRSFEAAGFKKWGLEMQDDLTDSVRWAIAQGIADPARIVISGASYGGYATMAGLVYTPELYCAGINYVGATDIEILIPKAVKSDRMYWYNTRIGDLGNAADRKRIHDTSPVHFAERVRAPLLMAYGKNDPRVRIDHGYDMDRALKKAGKTCEMIIEADEGHGFRKEEKSIAFFTRVDAFLKKYVVPQGAQAEVGARK